jgi:biofilm protein TabA
MIWDTWENRRWYFGCHPGMKSAFDFIDRARREALPPGRYPLPEGAYALVQEYDLTEGCRGRWESHRRYADVQYLLEGAEAVGCRPADGGSAETPYDGKRDIRFYLEGEGGVFLKLRDGGFAVFFPQDAHCPQCWAGAAGTVRKVVVKLPI